MRLIRTLLKGGLVLVVVLGVWLAVRADAHATAFRREIVVNVPPRVAWDYFSRPKQWASWLGDAGAPTAVGPTDVIGPDTTATFAGGFQFRMTQFDPYRHWMWSAPMGPMTIDYDHIFEPLNDRQTRMVFYQTVTGFGNDVMAALLGAITGIGGGHQAALNRLADEINGLPEAAAR
jgi:uncharacterized protein YndB with AHSA1/START domain